MANPKLYLRLFHGRKDVTENLEDWGSNGPTIGPFDSLQCTYSSHLRLYLGDDERWLKFTEDCLTYDGVHYGDWAVITELNSNDAVLPFSAVVDAP